MRTAGGAVVTPDMVLEAEEGRGGAGYRAVGEIKSSFPQHRSAVDQMVRQVSHYDGELAGWEDEASSGGRDRRDDQDIVIVARSEHAPGFAAGIPAAFGERGVEIKSPLSILGIRREAGNGDATRLVLRRTFGTISHKKAHAALGRGWSIDAYSLMNKLNRTKFCDSRPPLPYIMSVLWFLVFPSLVHAKKRKKARMNKEILIDVDVDRIQKLASKYAHPSNPGCVKRAWVKDAMEEFARIGLAERTGRDEYRIRYSARGPRQAEWLVRVTASWSSHANGPTDGPE